MAWLLYTNVLSELRKPRAERKVLEFIAASPLQQLYISVVSLAEIRFGIELSVDAQRRAALQDWTCRTGLRSRCARCSIHSEPCQLPKDIMLKWRVMLEDGRKTGHTFSQPDLIIAATAA